MKFPIDVHKLEAGDHDEFRKLYQYYFPYFLSFAYGYIKSEDACRDIVQDIFTVYWERHSDFPELPHIEAFFYRSIRNRCLNEIRRSGNKSFYALEDMHRLDSADYFEERIINEEVNMIIRDKITELPPQAQKILKLSLRNKSNLEIAEALSISVNTVKVHKARAYSSLRRQLEKLHLVLQFVKIG